MKKKRLPRWVALFASLVIFIIYYWELFSTDWSYSLARLPNVILFIVASKLGIFISLPSKEKTK